MKYNILIITSSYPAISGESFEGACVEVFAQALAMLGNNVTILTQGVRRNYYKDSQYLSIKRFQWSKSVKPLSTLRLIKDPGKIALYFFKGMNEADKIIRERHIDLTICAWALPSGLFGLYLKKRYGIPYIVWALGSDIWSYSTASISRYILHTVLGNAIAMYADGNSLIKTMHSMTKKSVKFLPTSRILPKTSSVQLDLNPDKTHFLFVGRYHINKGPDLLIEAIHLLGPILQKQSYFHCFGLGEMQKHLESMIEKYNLRHCIDLNGPINSYKLAQYLELVDFAVIPSRIESIPVILSDALQKQCSVIATNVGDMGALLTEYKIGYLSKKADPESISNVLTEAMQNKNIYQDDMKALYNLFDPDINAKRFLKDLESLPVAPSYT